MFSSVGKGGSPTRHPNHAHGCPRCCYGLTTSLRSHGDRDQTGSSSPMCQGISTWRWIFLGDIQLLEALARRFLHFESLSRLSETCLVRSGASSLVACARLVSACVLRPLTLPGCRGRFCSSDEALPEYKLRIVFVANGFYWRLDPMSRERKRSTYRSEASGSLSHHDRHILEESTRDSWFPAVLSSRPWLSSDLYRTSPKK